ncbi:serine protease [Halioxenophilus sp. WMMB6]|uniref:S1C family serine protease n=1 Tax=Halioxenophilus sp. WMMB6 TaxID=3073815 RepID=UPI00295ED397|nr:serine protease [Halioxenophilus sp. WMMB6]
MQKSDFPASLLSPLISLVLLCTCSLVSAGDANELLRLKQAVIKIYTTRAAPDYFTPWRLLNLEQTSGSGAVISGNRILTNAHVVADARYLQVQKHDDPQKYLASVEFVSHEADLAIVAVNDQHFFDGLKPLTIGKLPAPLTEVSVFGFPFGGQTLSITRGVLSRVEHQRYAHAGSYLLAGQIDAAINPGNSGGPVIVDNKIVGVVMQANAGANAENQGYFVPPPIINHVLKDAEDGVFNGVPDLGFRTQSLESPASRRAHGLENSEQGVLVTKVFADSSAFGQVQENDVLLAINNHPIANDQTIRLAEDLRTDYKYIVDDLQPGDPLRLQLARAGHRLTVTITADQADTSRTLVQGLQYDQQPRYIVYGGVVFVPLNMNLIKRWGHDWPRQAPIDFLHARNEWAKPEQRELVVALKVLAADVNLGYHNWSNWIISEVNGTPIRDFSHFAEMLYGYQGEFIRFSDDKGNQMVLDHPLALESEASILERYGLPASQSSGLYDHFASMAPDAPFEQDKTESKQLQQDL